MNNKDKVVNITRTADTEDSNGVKHSITVNTSADEATIKERAHTANEIVDQFLNNIIHKQQLDGINITDTPVIDPSQITPLVFEAINNARTNRINRAMNEEMEFTEVKAGWTTCTNTSGRIFDVYLDMINKMGWCSCEDFQNRGIQSQMPCKHIYAAILWIGHDMATYIKQEK